MKIFSGSTNKPLAEKIVYTLHISVSLLEIHIFSDGEKRIRILEDVVDQDTVVIQPTAPPVDSAYMELFFIVDALKRTGAKSVTVVMPYLGYQRQDHVFREGEAVSLEVALKTLEAVGTAKLVVFDLHSIKTAYISKMPLVHLSALPLFANKIKEHGWNTKDSILITPDMGGIRRVKQLSEMLDAMAYGAIEKNRDLTTGAVSASEIKALSGGLAKRVIMVDDMISSGETIVAAANILHNRGAKEILVFATHPVFSDHAPKRLQEAKVEKVFVTDTIAVPKEKQFPKLEILSVADTIAKTLMIE